MRKMIISTMMTLNGSIENPQNWSFDYWSDEIAQYAYSQLFACDALVMGRLTYEGFSQAWSARAGTDAFADRMNSLPKYVASRTLQPPLTWNATLMTGDIAAFVALLKQEPGQDILQYGCGEVTRALLEAGLIDELRLLVYPVVASPSKRLFDNVDKAGLQRIDVRTFDSGVIALHYAPVKSS